MHKYISTPNEISFNSIISKKACLAPSKFNDFYPNPKVDFRILSSLITTSKNRKKIAKSELYCYTEIGDIDVNTGFVKTNPYFGYFLPSESALEIKKNDILISTVRTYRKGIGMVESEADNLTCTPAIFIIRAVDSLITKDYLLAILRSDFFTEQILSLQNRGMYPRLDSDTAENVFIPIPNQESVLNYISSLSRAVINKNKLITQRNKQILESVKNEIKQNQKGINFEYTLPSLSELSKNGRIDAGYYSENYKQSIFETQNYVHGFYPLNKAGFQVIPGPSLEIKLLGTRIDSDKPIEGFYRLVTPKQFSDYGTISYYEYIGTPRKIKPLQYGDVLFGESGTGRSLVYIDNHDHTINNAHAHILRRIEGECTLEKAITIRAILSYYKNIGVIDHLTVGGSGGHLSPSYFDRVFIPNFPLEIQKKISLLYHNPLAKYNREKFDSNNFNDFDNKFNQIAGITELDSSAKKIQGHLDETIDKLVRGEEVDVTYSFLD